MTAIDDSGPVGTYPLSGNPSIDPLVWLGFKWGSSGAGTPTVVTYSFPTSTSKWSNDYKTFLDNEPFNGFSAFTAAQQTAAQQAMALWSEVANISFQQVAETTTSVGDIRFGNSRSVTQSDAAAWAYTPLYDGATQFPENGDIWFDRAYAPNLQLQPGQFGFETMLHEIGHAIGLDHPFQDEPGNPSEPVLPSILDNVRNTLMSYNPDHLTKAYASTPQILDILAIQYIYGANMTTRTGDDLYIFSNSVETAKTIWDAGGHDTLDFSNQKQGTSITLEEGGISRFNGAFLTSTASALGIAYGAIIEDAIGTNFRDTMTGNHVANKLTAGSGNDTMIGLAGDDVLDGGTGDDFMRGGAGNDIYYVNSVGDKVAEDGSFDSGDWIYTTISTRIDGFYYAEGHIEHIKLLGSDSIDAIGNAWDNFLIGNGGNNFLYAGWGNDTMIGGKGDDTYKVVDANDVITEEADGGSDTLIAYYIGADAFNYTIDLNNFANIENATHDFDPSLFPAGKGGTLIGTAANNQLTGNVIADTLIGGDGDDWLDGAGGNDVLKGGGGNDTYVLDSAGDVVDEEGHANTADTVRTTINIDLGALASGAIEHAVLLGSADINATGNAAANALTGNAVSNLLDGEAGADTMAGGDGSDTYVVDNAADQVIEQANGGTDHVISSVSFNAGQQQIEKITLTGGAAINATGNALANTITGNAGDNLLDGGAGNDTLKGGQGNDTYVVHLTGDVIDEEGHADLSDAVIATFALNLASFAGGAIERATLLGKAALNLTGNASDNRLVGNDGANVIDGAGGADRMEGGLGNDTYFVDSPGDQVIEAGIGTDQVKSTATFTLGANVEHLTLLGSGAIDGTGNALANILIGNGGANRLDGAGGADKMTGGHRSGERR